MKPITVSRTIAADPDVVFDMITNIERSPEVVPEVTGVEFLGELRQGAGTRFREHRLVNGRSMSFELELNEYDAKERHARFLSDAGGTTWDTQMDVEPHPEGAQLTMKMEVRGHSFGTRLFNRVMRGIYRQSLVAHLGDVAMRCEPEAV